MTPKQKQLLVETLARGRRFLNGSGEFSAMRSMYENGLVSHEWELTPANITQDGLLALRQSSPPAEVFQQHLLLINGQPVAQILHNRHEDMERFLNDHQGL